MLEESNVIFIVAWSASSEEAVIVTTVESVEPIYWNTPVEGSKFHAFPSPSPEALNDTACPAVELAVITDSW
jgi:hypothetical protein